LRNKAWYLLAKDVYGVSYGLFLVDTTRQVVQDGVEGSQVHMGGLFTRLLIGLWKDQKGQDFIEYALLAAAIVIVVAGFLPPQILPSVSTIFFKITSDMAIS
jgi:Flp pilus assembly pilin Flp